MGCPFLKGTKYVKLGVMHPVVFKKLDLNMLTDFNTASYFVLASSLKIIVRASFVTVIVQCNAWTKEPSVHHFKITA